jgi:hypothetical protein
MIRDEQSWTEILQEIEALCIMHEKITQSSECREFNRRTALLLQRLEDAGLNRLADRTMDLLGPPATPRIFPRATASKRARDVLQRLREMVRVILSE